MLGHEELLTFSEAAAKLPRRGGKRVHVSTLWRWARKGIRGTKLETRRLGGQFYTSVEALDRFSRHLAELDLPDRGPLLSRNGSRSERQRQYDVARAERYLDKHGI